jgi:hypothetical protein
MKILLLLLLRLSLGWPGCTVTDTHTSTGRLELVRVHRLFVLETDTLFSSGIESTWYDLTSMNEENHLANLDVD